jgi:hypothetical protein
VYLNFHFLETYSEELHVFGYSVVKTIKDFKPGKAKDIFLIGVQVFIRVDRSYIFIRRFEAAIFCNIRWWTILKWIFSEIGRGGIDWIDLAQDRDQWRALVDTVMNL